MARTRRRNGRVEEFVKSHSWRGGKHPGYWRPQRKKGRGRFVDRKLIRYPSRYIVRNNNGEIVGYRI